MAEMSRRKRVLLLSILIVTIYPSKDSEKYIADDEAVRSNIKLRPKREVQHCWRQSMDSRGRSLDVFSTKSSTLVAPCIEKSRGLQERYDAVGGHLWTAEEGVWMFS